VIAIDTMQCSKELRLSRWREKSARIARGVRVACLRSETYRNLTRRPHPTPSPASGRGEMTLRAAPIESCASPDPHPVPSPDGSTLTPCPLPLTRARGSDRCAARNLVIRLGPGVIVALHATSVLD